MELHVLSKNPPNRGERRKPPYTAMHAQYLNTPYVTLLLVLLLALQVGGESSASDLSPSVTATCSQGFMRVRLKTKVPFHGVIHARDSRDNECLTYGTGDTRTFLTVNLLTPRNHPSFCGVVHDNDTEKSSLAIAVRSHRTLELAGDNYYVITCGRSGFRDTDSNTTSSVQLLLTGDGERITEATYGREYQLVAKMDKPLEDYGLRIRNCFAFSDKNSSVQLLNEKGCPEKNVLSQFVYDKTTGMATSTLYSMFRFPDSNTVHLQCDIFICKGNSCQEPLCVTYPDREEPVTVGGDLSEQEKDQRMMASTTVYVLEPGVSALGSTGVCNLGPDWLLWLCGVFGVLFLLMLCVNVFLCSAMTCTFSKQSQDAEEKAGSLCTVQEFDPYRSWSESQYGSRFSLDHPGTRPLETSRPLGPDHPGTRVLSPVSLPYTSLPNSKAAYSNSRPSSRNGKSNGSANGFGSIHYDNGPIYNGISTGPRPPPSIYQQQRARTPTRTPRSRARARQRAREAGQFDLAPDQYSLHSRPASQAGSYRNAMRSRISEM